MGSSNVLETVAEARERLSRHDPGVPSKLAWSPEPVNSSAPSVRIQSAHLTGVRISREGFCVLGKVKSVARGIVEVLTPTVVPVRRPLELTIAGCRPTHCEAVYSLPAASVCKVGIVFSSGRKPDVEPGTSATIHDLEPHCSSHGGTVLGVRNTDLSMFSKTTISVGAWVRVELEDWVLFGKVKDAVSATASGRLLGVHLHAAFAADSSDQGNRS